MVIFSLQIIYDFRMFFVEKFRKLIVVLRFLLIIFEPALSR